jgi:hypothetical protein
LERFSESLEKFLEMLGKEPGKPTQETATARLTKNAL